jgi:hypothetical protein
MIFMADNILAFTDITNTLKDFYLPALRVQLNENVTPFYDKIEKTKEGVSGAQIVMALRHGRNGGVGNRADNAALPTPNSRNTTQAKWGVKNIFGTMQITDKAIKASKDSKGAFASILEVEMEDLLTDAKNSVARQFYGDGTGILTTATGANTSAVVPVASTQYLEEGMRVDLIDVSDGTTINDSDLEIVSVDPVALTVTLSATPDPATANGDYIVVSGSLNTELTGLKAIMTANNTLYTINRANNKWFNPNVTAVGGALSFTHMQSAIDTADIKGSTTDYILTTYGVSRAYQNLLQASKRIMNTIKLEGGKKGYLEYNGIPVIPDRYVLSGQMFYLASENFKVYSMADWEFMDRDGGILKHKSGYGAYEAVLTNYCDLGCDKPNGQVLQTGITEA